MDYKAGDLPPKEKTFIPPQGSWKERTYYVVDVACSKHNPIHRAILYVGFIPDSGNPLNGGYTSLWGGSSTYDYPPHMQHYIRAVHEIPEIGASHEDPIRAEVLKNG